MNNLIKRMDATLRYGIIDKGSSTNEYIIAEQQFKEARDHIKALESSLNDLAERYNGDLAMAHSRIEELKESRRFFEGEVFDLISHLYRQKAFSERIFGPGQRTAGVCDHIRKELAEIEACPDDLEEWVDVIILAFDGAWRAGYLPGEIASAIVEKQEKNERRNWPDWRTVPRDKAIEHVKEVESE